MSDLEHGDEVTLELQATVIEVFDDGTIDVNLDDHGGMSLGGINLFVSDDEIQ